ncbi:hypothetical protein NFI96_020636 [Prochilodus magdalenae]|nr:hypothetical protein NFI96_020636 [Prochilodus magdalenae]
MCTAMPEPVCLVGNVNGSLHVSDDVIEYLYKINQPVVVVSVVGLYRTGKSYLMNRLAGKPTGFALGSTIESKTKGIWMWCVPHPTMAQHTLVLLDTEGLGDVDKGDSKNDAWIFCLAVLLSSTLVYNSRGTIDNTALEKLQYPLTTKHCIQSLQKGYVAELAEHIRIRSPSPEGAEDEDEQDDCHFVQFFPNFIWTVRDFLLELVCEQKGQITEDEYLDFALQLKKGITKKINDYNLPRQCIRSYFPTRKCFVFPMPASQDNMGRLEHLDECDIWPDFLKVTQRFCSYVFKESKVKTLKGGHRVTGRMFGHLVRLYVDTISSGNVPCLDNAVVAMAKIENQAAVEEGFKVYQSGMEQQKLLFGINTKNTVFIIHFTMTSDPKPNSKHVYLLQVKSLFPVSIAKISEEHQRCSLLSTTQFMKRSFKDENSEYLEALTDKVDKHYSELFDQNMEMSERKCQELLSDLYKEISEPLQNGEYTKPGGYELYCTHRDNIITQYQRQPNKGVKAEDVLEIFLSERSVEANSILQADKRLSENEKKIQAMPEPVCLVENVNGSLRANNNAIEYLDGINQPVVVVSVVGLYRTGKSYLMNRLAGKQTGFALGSTIESKTKGIWIWCVPHPSKAGHTLVLLDTEGLGDVDKGDSKNDAWIFCLAVLLSSTLVYNSRGTIDNTALEKLHYVTELAEQIRVKSPSPAEGEDEDEQDDCQFVQFFPNFIWTVRDFVLELVIEKKGQVTEDEYLEFALQLKKGMSKKDSNYNLPRQCIRSYFPTRKCFVFPLPASQDNMSRLEHLDERDIYPDFLKATERFCEYAFKESKVKTLKGGHRVTGRMFGHLVRLYVDTICSGNVPCLENAVVSLAKIENQAAVQEGLKVYQQGMEQVKLPVGIGEFTAEHQKHSNMATTIFMRHSFKDEQGEYLGKLAEAVEKRYAELLVKNIEVSEKICQELLSDLYKDMSTCLQNGEYTKPGGYELYCTHRDNIITQYQIKPNKGVKAADVLEEFLRNRNVEANSILQTDKKLTENEKKIKEEKEKAALIEQQKKAAEEKQVAMEQAMRAQKESHEERMQQMKNKFEEGKRLHQEELDKAVESKLAEQKDFLEKGFKDRANLLDQEIEQLKNKNKGNFFKDYVMPIISTATDVLSTVLQYKLMRKAMF